ncbi:LPS-assembly protein LptD [Aggregicoccus sp. 17bor-14]|uniref:LPS-assembly protein LptD n=1 Tax=Myxococcaceae TaxID=31 RepID=UPI00129C5673|nr:MULTISPECIES: LPS assembly protein LptD [Myxococcaceae]MBF5044320.1 LPS-assembly protein LptD [Simulacricoccus sp. 17bor-14]MRI90069.1 LPS-assembly protein LptD [Aggregicoccus sp. 17bor-14]
MPCLLPVLLLALGASAPLPAPGEGPQEVHLSADTLALDGLTQKAEASGRATLEGQGVVIRADTLSWDRAAGKVEARGNVTLVRGTLAVVAERLTANLLTRELAAEGALFMQKEGVSPEQLAQAPSTEALLRAGRTTLTFTATRFQLLEGDSYVVEDLEFTPCDCDATHPSWHVSASSARLQAGGRAHLKSPTIFVHGVPIFWTPYLSLPLSDRATGLLMPLITTSSLSGFSVDQPFFLTLGRSWDLTLTPGYAFGSSANGSFGLEGPRLGTELNYAPSAGTRGRISLRLLDDLRQQRDPRNPDPAFALDEQRGLRWNLRVDHAQDLGGGFHDRLDASLLSDGYLLRDGTVDIVASAERYIRSTGSLYHRSDDRYVGLGITFVQDIRYGFSFAGGDHDRAGNSVPGPRPLQRLPTVLYALPERHLGAGLFGSLGVEYSRMAPLLGGTEDTGTDGIFLPNDPAELAKVGIPGVTPILLADPDGTQSNGRFDPGEREARDRLDLRPQLNLPLAVGSFLRVTPYVAARESLYVGEVTGARSHRGYALGGVQLDSELGRTFHAGASQLRHTLHPALDLRAATPVVQGGTPGRYDAVDVATPDAGFLQARLELRQSLARKDARGAVSELARLELSQGMDLRTGRLGTLLGRLRTALGPVSGGAEAELDPEAQRSSERLARVGADAQWQVLRPLTLRGNFERTFLSSERLRRGLDALVGEPLPPCSEVVRGTQPCAQEGRPLLLGTRAGAGASLRLGFGLGLDYGLSLLRRPPKDAPGGPGKLWLEYQTVGVSYSPSCDCWRVDTRLTLRPGVPRPEFGFTVTLAKFGSFGS